MSAEDTAASPDEGRPIISYGAYHNFVSIIFSVAMAVWALTLFGITGRVAGREAKPAWELEAYFLAGGILYGGTLICFYWIYSDRIASLYRPRNLLVLIIDFISLSFLTAAAGGWTDTKYFNTVSIFTVLCLGARFIPAALQEWHGRVAGRLLPGETIMRDVCLVYAGYLVLVGVLMAGGMTLGGGIDRGKIHLTLYIFVMIGMVAGIGTTLRHSFRRAPEAYAGPASAAAANEEFPPVLIPAYGALVPGTVERVSKGVFAGEALFRRLVTENARPEYRFHQSLVHAYRDVETQAFIMAHVGRDEEEIAMRSMWVYLAHWFDDIFDGPAAATLAGGRFEKGFDIGAVLVGLDPSLGRVWRAALDRSARLKGWESRKWLLETGMRRLILGGPMFAASTADQHKRFMEAHKAILLDLAKDSAPIRTLVENSSERYLAYTAKVVVEIWDSFLEDPQVEGSVLMNMFYAPGLLYHDSDAEVGKLEMSRREGLVTDKVVREHLGKVFACLKELPQDRRKQALAPVPLFLGAFGPILEGAGLLEEYRAFLKDERVTAVVRRIPVETA
ncbi:MAG: hypothetical protein HYY18_18205 [Planctomycetes bacterium]|nr:hypothetical protein [Planctomycetota bacterium]